MATSGRSTSSAAETRSRLRGGLAVLRTKNSSRRAIGSATGPSAGTRNAQGAMERAGNGIDRGADGSGREHAAAAQAVSRAARPARGPRGGRPRRRERDDVRRASRPGANERGEGRGIGRAAATAVPPAGSAPKGAAAGPARVRRRRRPGQIVAAPAGFVTDCRATVRSPQRGP